MSNDKHICTPHGYVGPVSCPTCALIREVEAYHEKKILALNSVHLHAARLMERDDFWRNAGTLPGEYDNLWDALVASGWTPPPPRASDQAGRGCAECFGAGYVGVCSEPCRCAAPCEACEGRVRSATTPVPAPDPAVLQEAQAVEPAPHRCDDCWFSRQCQFLLGPSYRADGPCDWTPSRFAPADKEKLA